MVIARKRTDKDALPAGADLDGRGRRRSKCRWLESIAWRGEYSGATVEGGDVVREVKRIELGERKKR